MVSYAGRPGSENELKTRTEEDGENAGTSASTRPCVPSCNLHTFYYFTKLIDTSSHRTMTTPPPEPAGRAAPGHTSHGYPRFLSCRRMRDPDGTVAAGSSRCHLPARSAALIQLADTRALVLPRVAWQCAATRELAAQRTTRRSAPTEPISRRKQGQSVIIALLYDAPTERRATTRSAR